MIRIAEIAVGKVFISEKIQNLNAVKRKKFFERFFKRRHQRHVIRTERRHDDVKFVSFRLCQSRHFRDVRRLIVSPAVVFQMFRRAFFHGNGKDVVFYIVAAFVFADERKQFVKFFNNTFAFD